MSFEVGLGIVSILAGNDGGDLDVLVAVFSMASFASGDMLEASFAEVFDELSDFARHGKGALKGYVDQEENSESRKSGDSAFEGFIVVGVAGMDASGSVPGELLPDVGVNIGLGKPRGEGMAEAVEGTASGAIARNGDVTGNSSFLHDAGELSRESTRFPVFESREEISLAVANPRKAGRTERDSKDFPGLLGFLRADDEPRSFKVLTAKSHHVTHAKPSVRGEEDGTFPILGRVGVVDELADFDGGERNFLSAIVLGEATDFFGRIGLGESLIHSNTHRTAETAEILIGGGRFDFAGGAFDWRLGDLLKGLLNLGLGEVANIGLGDAGAKGCDKAAFHVAVNSERLVSNVRLLLVDP